MTPWRWVRRAAALLALLTALVFTATAVRVWQVAREDHRLGVDAIVVLGASQHDGRPSAVFRARLDHAAALYAQRVAPRVVTLGGSRPGDRFTEASSGARYLRASGVADVVEVPRGSDTLSSLRAAARELGPRGWTRVVLVTDPWHSLRSRTIAGDVGLRAQTSPTRAGPANRDRARELRYVLRESVAYLCYEAFQGGLRRSW